ncbi:MAG: zinc ribbon domain-containing protein [Byssovorax sp.]
MMSAPAASHTCRVCAASVPEGAAKCERCGAAQGDLGPCPLCNGQGGSSQHPELRFACDLCGGPRIPRLDPRMKSSGRENPLLRKADAARKARAMFNGLAVASGVALALTMIPFAVLLAVVGFKVLLLLPGLLFAGLFAGMLAFAVSRARSRGNEIAPALDGAWLAAATDVARQSTGPITAADLGQKLGIEEPQAEELLALLDVDSALGGAPLPRLRVAAVPDVARGVTSLPSSTGAAEAEALSEDGAADPLQRKL